MESFTGSNLKITHENTISHHCSEVACRADHALVAVSLFNGYYNRSRLIDLVLWASGRFSRFDVPIYDVPHAYTLAASGVSPRKAVQKAREEGQRLYKRISALFTSAPVVPPGARILTWDALSTNRRYLELMIEVERAFSVDLKFRRDCIEMTRQIKVCDPCTMDRSDADDAVSVRYLLSEIPLFMDTAGIVEARASVFCYHRSYEFHERFFNHEYAIGPADNQALLIVNFDDGDDAGSQCRRDPDRQLAADAPVFSRRTPATAS